MSRFPIILATTALLLFALGWWSIDKLKKTLAEREAAAQVAIPAEILPAEPAKKAGTPDPAPVPEPEPGAQAGTDPKPDETPGKPEPEPEADPEPTAGSELPEVAEKEETTEKDGKPIYTKGPKTFDGTGKYYMGREIAYVMGHVAIRWLERADREQEEAPSKAIAALNLKPTDVIADIGAGSGYYTFRLAPLVPKGKVIAVDIQPEMIAFLENKEKQLGLNNVEAHLGAVDDTKLKPNSIDSALMVDAYHEFSHPREMMQSLFKALKPGGRIILLEYRAEDPQVPIKPLHKMTEAQSRREMEAVGLKWKSTDSKLLPWQHFMVFVKP